MDEKTGKNGYDNQHFAPGWSNISVIVDIPGNPGDYNLESRLTEEMLKIDGGSLDVRPFAYFKIRDKRGEPVVSFGDNTPLILKVRYTASAWEASKKQGKDQPDIFYRQYDEEDGWVGDWTPISAVPKAPTGDDPFYYLTATFPALPDPAIGGC